VSEFEPAGSRSPSETRREALANGLTLLLRETHAAPVAELQVFVRAGSADEAPDEAGLAHFHEHMLFKGTERRGVGEVAGEVEGAGGRINAYTSFDVTAYHATVPSDRTQLALDVLADAVRHPAFDPEEIARETDVVLEEIARAEDSPTQVLATATFAEAFRVHPYRAPILGTRESVAAFDRARVRAFFERWYTPENMVVVAVGDFDAEALAAAAREVFGDARPGRARRARPPEPPQQGLRSVVLARPFQRAGLELAWPAVPLVHPDAAALDLLAFVLGHGDSSRLVLRVQERAALVDRIDASCYTPLDPGVFSVGFDSDAERAAEALAAVAAEIERVRREPIDAAELEKARTNFLAAEHFERESVTGIAQKLGGFELLAGDYRHEARYLASVRAATREDLQRVAREYLAPERLTVGAVLPQADQGALDAARIEAAVRSGVERTRQGLRVPARRALAPDLESYALPGGARLYVVPRRQVPVVAVRAAFQGGLLAEDAATAGLSSFTSSMWLRGTERRSAEDFARAAESLAAEIDGFSGRSSLGMTVEAPSEHLAGALELFAEALCLPAFDAEELERERRETLAAIARREDRLAARAYLLFAETQFQRHPYRLPLLGSAESVAAFDVERVAAHHARLVRAPNLVLAVAGDVEPDAVAQQLGARFAELAAGPFEAPWPPLEPEPAGIRRAELVRDRAQAHLVIGFRGLSVRDPDRFALEIVAQILAGQGGRLFLELRDRQGLAYSVTATNAEGLAPGTMSVYIATAPEKLEQARRGLLAELARLLEAPPEEEELERARRFLVGNFAIDAQRSAVHAAHAALDTLYGLGPDASRRYTAQIAAVGKDDVLRVARRVIRLDCRTEVCIRPGN
jgi:zinc protease